MQSPGRRETQRAATRPMTTRFAPAVPASRTTAASACCSTSVDDAGSASERARKETEVIGDRTLDPGRMAAVDRAAEDLRAAVLFGHQHARSAAVQVERAVEAELEDQRSELR